MQKLQVSVRQHPVHGHGLTFSYNSRMVDLIKKSVRPADRTYDPGTRTWWISRVEDVTRLQWTTNGWAEFTRVGGEAGGKTAAH